MMTSSVCSRVTPTCSGPSGLEKRCEFSSFPRGCQITGAELNNLCRGGSRFGYSNVCLLATFTLELELMKIFGLWNLKLTRFYPKKLKLSRA